MSTNKPGGHLPAHRQGQQCMELDRTFVINKKNPRMKARQG
ncbi:50S ribosomal protein L36 [Arthrobacter sp. AFG7.2]|nr:ribosomal protein bL36 [Arthrobacter sp. AFG7.2]PNI07364.1 50S ribosomal protein L36 [Arthrobacter sp. AFG7.2]